MILLFAVVMTISLISNVYCIYKINEYKYVFNQQSVGYIEEIRQRNESNVEILSKCIKDNSVKNSELLMLYKNYDVIGGEIISLWQRYSMYSENIISIGNRKNIDTNKAIENDIHGFVKEYLLSTLNNEMKNEKNKLELLGEDKKCFEAMYEMSKSIDEYFNKFNKETLNNAEGKEKEKIIIKNHYWIDILKGIYDISDDYVNVQWKIETEPEEEIVIE